MESNTQPSSGICQRLLRLVFGATRRAPTLPAPPSRPINVEGSEIMVDFRHTTKSGVGDEGHKGNKKSVAFKKEGEDHDGEASARATMDEHDEAKTRRHWPLLGVASNINEKSEAFIESKKRALGRNYSLDQGRKK